MAGLIGLICNGITRRCHATHEGSSVQKCTSGRSEGGMAYFLHLPLLASRSCISFAASVPPFRPGERAMTERQGGECGSSRGGDVSTYALPQRRHEDHHEPKGTNSTAAVAIAAAMKMVPVGASTSPTSPRTRKTSTGRQRDGPNCLTLGRLQVRGLVITPDGDGRDIKRCVAIIRMHWVLRTGRRIDKLSIFFSRLRIRKLS